MKRKFSRLTALVLAAVLLLSMTPHAFAEEAVSVTLDQTKLTLALDGSAALTATVKGGAEGSTVTWTSSNAAAATVDTNGKVTAVAAGEAVITAIYTPAEGAGEEGVRPSASCTVTVAAPTVRFTSELPVLAVGDKVKLNAVVENGVQGGTLIYAVDSLYASTVRVDDNGTLTAQAAGMAKIKAIYTYSVGGKSGNAYAEAEVIVNALSISATPVVVELEVGQTKTLTGITNSTTHDIEWVSSNSTIAAVDEHGKIKAISPGIANISAVVGGVSSSPVAVTVSGMTLDRTQLDLFLGKTGQLACTLFGVAANQTVLWSSSNVSVAGVKNGKVAAYNVGTAVITATAGNYSVSCTVTVTEDVAQDIPESVVLGQVLSFNQTLIEAIRSAAAERIKEELIYVSGLTVSPEQGVLYYAYSSADAPGQAVGSSDQYYAVTAVGEKKLSQVSFVPAAGFTGTAIITYTAYGPSASFTGRIRVTVTSSGDVSYTIPAGKPLLLTADDFAVICEEKTGRALRYVTFGLPSESKGILYYNYNVLEPYPLRVDETTRYYLNGGGMQLSRVTFLPASNYTGILTIPYTGTDTAGESYTGFITVTVYAGDLAGTGSISYQTAGGSAVVLDGDDFNEACREAIGANLHYIYIEQPDPTQGRFYYNFSSLNNYGSVVSENSRYFYSASSTPNIGKISFVPADGFAGVVNVPFRGYSSAGKRFDGVLTIRVTSDSGVVSYTTTRNRAVTFNGLDFTELCLDVNGAALSRVSFTLPSGNEGTLYYNYKSTNTNNTRVSQGNFYSVSSVSNITFVPRSGYSGTVSIPFKGYDENGNRINGTVVITVQTYYLNDEIQYKTLSGKEVDFSAEDFNDACLLITGDNLDYVTFTSPSNGNFRYHGSNTYSYTFYREATSSTTRTLSEVSFMPKLNYTGTVTLSYTGKSTGGVTFNGTVKITVSAPQAAEIIYYGGSLPVKLAAADFEDACSNVMPQNLSCIIFTSLPEAAEGKLLLNYTQPNTGTAVKTGTRYYANSTQGIGKLCFIAKADFRGTATADYTAVDTHGNEVSGTITFQISDANIVKHFTDMKNHSWAVSSIEYVYGSGIMDGTGSGQFKPGNAVTRDVFVGTVCRMLNFTTRRGTGFDDVSTDNPYYTEIMTAQAMGIAKGDGKGHFKPDEVITREEAIAILVRAMKAANIPIENASVMLLDAYNDRTSVSNYATGDMASMIKMGILKGDANGNLNPQALIIRAEMAILIHRVLTL